jgi:hypothetical protein
MTHDSRKPDDPPVTRDDTGVGNSGGPRLDNAGAGDTAPLPRIQIGEAVRFLECLDPGARYFTFQTFDDDGDRKDKRLAKILHGTLAQHAAKKLAV